MDDVLKRHEPNLRRIFATVSGSEGKTVGQEHLLKLCDLTEWRAFMRAMDFIGPDLTERDAMLCFANARMDVIDGQSSKGAVKETNLTFEGFLEAVVRLSVLKALPTDEEIFVAGFSDAGAFLKHLRENEQPCFPAYDRSSSRPRPRRGWLGAKRGKPRSVQVLSAQSWSS